ncbi:MAG: T9SS type A sorting domain-containing protein [Bacteroidales bacterium]|nr:T9SS type A sorting domain-containing protein [Bacteroidales bacterium]
MKTNFKALALALALGLIACQAMAQEVVTRFNGGTEKAPVRRDVAPARFLPFFDDFSQSTVYPDSTKWTDNGAMVNDGFPMCPPNRNGVTLDVLDANGRVYDYAISNAFVAEYLTSVRIRLDSIMEPEPRALTPADSVYLSFYYQPQGNGLAPEPQDSLVLQFGTTTEHEEFLYLDYQNYSIAEIFEHMQVDTLFPGDTVWAFEGCTPGLYAIITDTLTPAAQGQMAVPCDSVFTTVADTTWYHIWSVPGQTLQAFMEENHGAYFKQVMIPIRDLKYFRDDFYFRFYNYASIVNASHPSERSNEDNWNIDFVYLNAGRSMNDTDYPMLTFAGQRPTFFNRYQAIPYRQYRVNPNSAMSENLELDIANLDGVDHEAHYYYKVQQVGGGQHYERHLETAIIHPYKQDGYLSCPEFGESPACPYVGELFALDMWRDSVSYLVSHYIYDSACTPPLMDSMVYRMGMYNYYAYDDGIPELGFGLSVAGGKFAVRFDVADYDTIQGVQLLFNHTLNDANNKYFDIVVWKDENGKPGEEIYRLASQRPQWQEQPYRFSYYKFDHTVVTANTFYIGIEQRSNDLINIGMDATNDNSQYNFYNTNGSWQPSSKHGSLMIRPVVGANYFIGVEENGPSTPSTGSGAFMLYPNPVHNTLHIEADIDSAQISIFDLMGRKVFEGEYRTEISLDHLCNGMYFIQVTTHDGQTFNQKFIIEK